MSDFLDEYGRVLERKRRFNWFLPGLTIGLLIGLAVVFLVRAPSRDLPAQAATGDSTAHATTYTVPFTIDPSSGLMVITAVVNINPGHLEALPPAKQLVIDTGSPRTCFFVSQRSIGTLAKIIPGAKQDVWQKSDGSSVNVCRFDPASVEVAGFVAKMQVYASAYNMDEKPDYDGLLGMDFLARFIVTIDGHAKTITLTER